MTVRLLAPILDKFSDLKKKKITATSSVKPPIPVHTDSVWHNRMLQSMLV